MAAIELIRRRDMSRDEWDALTGQAPHTALTQSWAYAEALASARGWLPDFYTIEQSGRVLGGCIVQSRQAGPLRAIRIERGPFWLDAEQPTPAVAEAALAALELATRPGLIGRRRFYPDIEVDAFERMLPATRFRPLETGYRSIYLDLSVPLAERRKGLRRDWRNSLKRSERGQLTIEEDRDGETLPWLAANHVLAMRQKRFTGPSSELLTALARQTVPTGDYLALRAIYLGKPVAGALFIRHGKAATYLVGWSGKVGRRHFGQYHLLWRALALLPEMGVTLLDLGGINPETAEGVTYFKRGMLLARTGDREVTMGRICR